MSAYSSQTPGRWVTQQEAARELGISTEAVRMRVRRGSLESSKDDQGRVVVWAVFDRTQSSQETARQPDELVEALEDRIESLERSLEHERESLRGARTPSSCKWPSVCRNWRPARMPRLSLRRDLEG